MLRRFPRPISVTAGLATLLAAPAVSAAGAIGSGWQPSRPLWEVQQVQATAADTVTVAPAPAVEVPDAAAVPDTAPVVQTLRPPEDPIDRLLPRDTLPTGPETLPDRGLPSSVLGTPLPRRQVQNLPRPYTPPQVPPTSEGEPRTSVVAEELSYDDAADVVTARGKVELVYEGRVLRADTVRYDTVADRVTAEGDVVLMETDGSVYFFDYAELTGDMKEGFAREATLMLADRSRATGELMTRENDVNTMRKAIYTACDPCEDPDAAPLWRLRARRITHDEADKTVYYRDAWMEFAGLPVFYTPYLSHPDPTVPRKSGVMPPSYGYNADLGTQITVPYYIVIDDQQDAEVALRWTSIEGPVFEAAYSGLFASGETVNAGSITSDSDGTTRGHIKSEMMWHFDNTWRGGWDVALASDDTYMRKYRYGTDSWLVSEAFLEGFGRRSYARARGLYFQEMRENSAPGTVPVVLPDLGYSFVSQPYESGAYWTFDASSAVVTREDGTDSRRAAAEAAFHYPYYGSFGDVTEFMVALRGDAYSIGEAEDPALRDVDGGFAGRVVPTAGVSWRLPLTRDNGWFREVLEPMASAYVSPNDASNDEIPNEDSRDFEFDATNLFDRNRFTGWDQVETGARVNYGLQWSAYWPGGESLSLLFGQTYHFDDTVTGFGSDGEGGVSDYVGRAIADISPWLTLGYRVRLDHDDYTMRRQELSASAGAPVLRVGLSYLQTSAEPGVDDMFGDREEISVSATSRLSRYWYLYGATTLSLTGDATDNEPLKTSLGAIYDDECFTIAGTISNDVTEDRDYEGGTEILLRVVFKTLGELEFGSAGSGDE